MKHTQRFNLTEQWYARWKAEQKAANADYINDFYPKKRFKLYTDIKLAEARLSYVPEQTTCSLMSQDFAEDSVLCTIHHYAIVLGVKIPLCIS